MAACVFQSSVKQHTNKFLSLAQVAGKHSVRNSSIISAQMSVVFGEFKLLFGLHSLCFFRVKRRLFLSLKLYLQLVSLRLCIKLGSILTQPRKPAPCFLCTFFWFQTEIVRQSFLPRYLEFDEKKNTTMSLTVLDTPIFRQFLLARHISSSTYRSKCLFHFGLSVSLHGSVE